jgi:cobalt-zinc-cadmium efflux system membrane fusion protein
MRKIILLTITTIILASCGRNQTANPSENIAEVSANTLTLSTDQLRAADVKLGQVERQMIGTSLQVNGMLDVPPQNLITIAAPMGGFVKSTKLLQGMKVKKGELLATLESQEYIQLQQDYLDHKSKLEFLESEYKRQLELAKENVNAQKTLQQAKAQYQSADAIVRGLEAKLGMINISIASLAQDKIRSTINLHAPLNGYVTVINVNIGQYVNAADEIFKIVNLEHLHAELQVFERDIHSLRIGQKVTFKLANENNLRTATVHLIGKEIGPERTVRVHCHLDKEDENLLPGMYITANIEIDPREVDALPANAIVNYEGSDFVFVQNGGNKFTMTKVKTGTSAGYTVEVQLPDTFDRNSAIVTNGAFDLLGMLKNTKEDE